MKNAQKHKNTKHKREWGHYEDLHTPFQTHVSRTWYKFYVEKFGL